MAVLRMKPDDDDIPGFVIKAREAIANAKGASD